MKKSVISILLAAILILAAGCSGGEGGAGDNPPPKEPETPVSDFEYKYDASAGGVVITEYTGTSIKVRIPEKIEGEPVVEIGKEAFKGSGIMEIYIPNSVTRIGSSAFRGCSGLTSITIPDSVTSIGDGAFSYCTGLTSITIPDGVTNIGDYAFVNCKELTSITIPDSVTSIGDGAFNGCPNLTATYKGKTYTANLWGMPREFYDAVNGQ